MFADFYYHKLKVTISPSSDLQMNGWFCSSLRNNFLFATEKIKVGKVSLREIINSLPIKESHPLYSNIKESFPKGFYISVDNYTAEKLYPQDVIIPSGDNIIFNLILIGNTEKYSKYFIKALQAMCERGIGKKLTPLELKEVVEYSIDGEKRVVFTQGASHIAALCSPIVLSDYLSQNNICNNITFSFQTPTYFRSSTSSNTTTSCTSYNSNDFPSFYKLISAILYRLEKLWVLYIAPMEEQEFRVNHIEMKKHLDLEYQIELRYAKFRLQTLLSTPKKECETITPLRGFVGKLRFKGDLVLLLPYISMAQELGIGKNIAYGLGNYIIEPKYE